MDKQELPAPFGWLIRGGGPEPVDDSYQWGLRVGPDEPYCAWTYQEKKPIYDAAALTAQAAEVARLRDALLHCARLAEALKLPCGDDDPESPQAIRNGQYQNISLTAHIALGTIRGPAAPSEAEEIARLTAEVEGLRKDAARYHWLRSRVPGGTYRIMGVIYSDGGAGVDAAIDAAMAAELGRQTNG